MILFDICKALFDYIKEREKPVKDKFVQIVEEYPDIWTWGLRFVLHPLKRNRVKVDSVRCHLPSDEIIFQVRYITRREIKFLTEVLHVCQVEKIYCIDHRPNRWRQFDYCRALVFNTASFLHFMSLFIEYIYDLEPELRGRQAMLCKLFLRWFSQNPIRRLLKFLSKRCAEVESQFKLILSNFSPDPEYLTDKLILSYQPKELIPSDLNESYPLEAIGGEIYPGVVLIESDFEKKMYLEISYPFIWKFALKLNWHLSIEDALQSLPEFVAEFDMLQQHQWPSEAEIDLT